MRLHLDLDEPTFEYRPESWPGYLAPMLMVAPPDVDYRKPGGGDGPLEWREAMFGLVPYWAKDTKISRQTYNARSETVHEKSSYRGPWARRRFCILPAERFYEPCYESGKPVRWRIERADGGSFGIAGIWDIWDARGADGVKDGNRLQSFSLLTINADEHPLMRRFHAPGDEKRSVVIVPRDRWDDWLRCPDEASARSLLLPFIFDDFVAQPDPVAPRSSTRRQVNVHEPAAPAPSGTLPLC